MKSCYSTILLIVGLFCPTLGNVGPLLAQEQKPLNVVFILADDLGWGELGCYGQQKIPTPNIDALAAKGMRFTQHYAGAPVCAPSRCVLLTGRHLGHSEIRGNRQAKVNFPQFTEGQHPLSARARTIGQSFQEAGYRTAAFGKWGLGPVGSTGEPAKKGFELFFGYNCQAVAHSYFPAYLWRNDQKIPLNAIPIPGSAKQPNGDVNARDWQGDKYAPKEMIAAAESFLDDNHQSSFFLYLPFIEPHVAMHPPQESVDRFPVDWDQTPYRGESSYLPHPRPHAAYAAMINDLDSYVGRIVAKLEHYQLIDHTLIVFTSDNGTTHEGPKGTQFHIGGADPKFFDSTKNLRGYKGSVYEGGIRVPMIASLPGTIPAGTVSDAPSYFADWLPTLCDAARFAKPEGCDGESLWPILCSGTPAKDRRPMVWVFPEYGGQVAVRMGKWKALRRQLSTKKPGPWELYDIENDPQESVSRADEFPQWIEEAERILAAEVDANEAFPLAIPGLTLTSKQIPKEQPNILVFLVDDLGCNDLGCYGSTFYETPHIDRLAEQGLRFTNAYAACPVCSPTRASLMTGLWPQRTGVTDYIGAPQPEQWNRNTVLLPAPYHDRLPLGTDTIASRLKDAGYTTFFAGKWHLGPEGNWPEDFGFDFNLGGIDRGGPYGGKKYFSPYGNPRLSDGPEGEHLPDRLATEANQFISANASSPFFAYVSFYSVHTPLIARKDLEAKYIEKRKRLNGETLWGREGDRDVRLTQDHAVYAAMVEAMDQAVGKVLDHLEHQGLSDNTLVIFTSDNGGLSTSEGWPTSNAPLRGGKGWMYEGGIRVPWIMRWPKKAPGKGIYHTPICSPDLLPTLIAASGGLPKVQGAQPAGGSDGLSLLPLLAGETLPQRPLFWHYPHYGNQGGAPGTAVRFGNWKWIRWYENNQEELFDLAADPSETSNCIDKNEEIANQLRLFSIAWQNDVKAVLPAENASFDPNKRNGRAADRPTGK
jgi:arylsulfatase A